MGEDTPSRNTVSSYRRHSLKNQKNPIQNGFLGLLGMNSGCYAEFGMLSDVTKRFTAVALIQNGVSE